MKKNSKFLGPLLLLITALLWGLTFLPQLEASKYVGSFTFNASRFLFSGVVIAVVYLFIRNKDKKENSSVSESLQLNKKNIIGGVIVGISLFAGSALQQLGISLNGSPSETGFISSTYIVLVPIFGLIFKQKIQPIKWIFIVLALTGSYLISIDGPLSFDFGDLIVFASAIAYAMQIILIGIFAKDTNPILLSSIEFLTTGVLALICQFIFEGIDMASFKLALVPILFCAVFSGCIGFTLQVIGQKRTPASIACVIMGLEGVFSMLFSLVFKFEPIPEFKVWIGCAFILCAVILIQFDYKGKKKNEVNNNEES